MSEGKTPAPQDMALWLNELKEAWKEMRKHSVLLSSISDIVNGSVGFWPGIRMSGVYEELPEV